MPENKPNTIVEDMRAICHQLDSEMEKPEVVYKFSNAKQKVSTDRTEEGIYRRD